MRRVLLVSLLLATAASGAAAAPRPIETAVVDPETFAERGAAIAFRRTAGAGATFVRLSLDWRSVAPEGTRKPRDFDAGDPNDRHYAWGGADRQVKLARESGLEPILTLTNAPAWGQKRDPAARGLRRADPVEFRLFALAAARHFDGRDAPLVRYWQIWNEPNHPGNAALLKGVAAWYRELVNAAARAIHSVRPSSSVVAGGQSPFRIQTAAAPLTFMRQLLCLSADAQPRRVCGARVEFDIWSHHPYTSGGPTRHAFGPHDVSLGDLPEMGAVLRAAVRLGAVRSKQRVRFWVTEFAWDTSPPDPKGVPMRLQTRWVAEAIYRMWSWGVGLVAWWRIRDAPLATSFYQSGLYFRGSSIGADRAKSTLYAFRFPFAAFLEPDGVDVWGRTPNGKPGRVVVEQTFRGGWKQLGTLGADRYGIFAARYPPAASARDSLRARLAGTSTTSVPFSLTRPPDKYYPPFGS